MSVFSLGSWGINRSAEQTNRPRTASRKKNFIPLIKALKMWRLHGVKEKTFQWGTGTVVQFTKSTQFVLKSHWCYAFCSVVLRLTCLNRLTVNIKYHFASSVCEKSCTYSRHSWHRRLCNANGFLEHQIWYKEHSTVWNERIMIHDGCI